MSPLAPRAQAGVALAVVVFVWCVAQHNCAECAQQHNNTPPTIRQAVAFVIRHPEEPSKVVTVTRPSDAASLPGVVGLPAGYVGASESHEQAVRTQGMAKLGVGLRAVRFVGRGRVVRSEYTLVMEEYEAVLDDPSAVPVVPQPEHPGTQQYASWQWGEADSLRPAAAKGSLCSRIYLTSQGEQQWRAEVHVSG